VRKLAHIPRRDPKGAAALWLRGEATLSELRGYSEEDLSVIAEVGYALYRRRRYDLAAVVFDGLAVLTGQEYPVRALAAIAMVQGRFEEALAYADVAVARGPFSLQARQLRAECLMHLGRHNEAQAELERIVQAAPRDAEEEAIRRRAAALLRPGVRSSYPAAQTRAATP